jgi:hypothetical protein
MREIAEINQQIAEFSAEGNRAQVDSAADDLQVVRDFLARSKDDIENAGKTIDEKIGDLEQMSEGLKDLLNDSKIGEFVSGVTSGLDDAAGAVGEVNDGLDSLEVAIATFQQADDLSKEDAQSQIEALADAFESVVGKLEHFVDLIPGLGAFLHLYGLGIRNIADSTGQMQSIVDRNRDIYDAAGLEGELYVTAESMRRTKLERLEDERDRLEQEGLEIVRGERDARTQADLNTKNTDVEAAVASALRSSRCREPKPGNATEKRWVAASDKLIAARDANNTAKTNLEFTTPQTPETRTRLEERVDQTEAELRVADNDYQQARDAQRADWRDYNDCVKREIAMISAYANGETGFTDLDYLYLEFTYPQWTLVPDDVPTTPPPPPVPASPKSRTAVYVGGGALAGMLLIAGFLVLPNLAGAPPTPATDGPSSQTQTLDTQTDDVVPDTQIDAAPETPVEDDVVIAAGTSDSVTDPTGDLERSFVDLDPIDPTRSVDGVSGQDVMDAIDLISMQVVSNADDSATEIRLKFNGDAQEIPSQESGTLMSRSFGGDVVITRPGERVLNVLWEDDGKIKISDIPPGMSITSEWLTPDEMSMLIAGLVLNPGTQVEAFLLIEAYGGFMTDVLSLITTSA